MEDNGVSCNGLSDGAATVTPTGGTMPYNYLWDNGEMAATATNLPGGNHSVVITDANNCTTTASVLISEPTLLTLSAMQNTGVSCNGLSDGSATATPAGGTPGYNYLWDNGEMTPIASNLTGGNHSVVVTDMNGCTATAIVLINEPTLLSSSASVDMQVSCFGQSDGAATVTPTGGTIPYTYSWDNGEMTASATNLNAGPHDVVVTDGNG